MGGLGLIEATLAELRCAGCRSPSHQLVETFTPYIKVDISSPETSLVGTPPVTLDVQAIHWTQTGDGSYTASATISIMCPNCGDAHTLRHHMTAPVLLIRELGSCATHGGALTLNSCTVSLSDEGEGKTTLKVRAQLACSKCTEALQVDSKLRDDHADSIARSGAVAVGVSDSGELCVTGSRIDVLLVVATEVEMRAVLDVFSAVRNRPVARSFKGAVTYYDLGRVGGARVMLAWSGMGSAGPSGSALTVRECLMSLKPSAVVMAGIAFGMDDQKQSISDVLVAERLVLYEHQRVGTRNGRREVLSRGDRVTASSRLLDRMRSSSVDWETGNVHFGDVLSGDKLVDNSEYREELRRLAPEAIGGEMEGAGLYAAAARTNTEWVLVKAICDWADGEKAMRKRERQELAARNAASFVLRSLQQAGWVRAPEAQQSHVGTDSQT